MEKEKYVYIIESLTEFPTGSPNNNSWHTSATKVAMQVEADMLKVKKKTKNIFPPANKLDTPCLMCLCRQQKVKR